MQNIINFVKRHPVLFYSVSFVFIVGSWPFINFPFTDGDIAHWIGIAKEIQRHGNFLTSTHDQAHGPFLYWASGILSRMHPGSLYFYNLANLLCGVLGIGWVYYFAIKNWADQKIASLAVVIASTSIVWLYLSRTPMYDWPAAIFLFGFFVHYLGFAKSNSKTQLLLSLICVAIAGMSRMSIAVGLASFYIFGVTIALKRSPFKMIRDGFVMVAATIGASTPWILMQTQVHGASFFDTFFYDNLGRYIREPGNAPIYRDYYGFAIYVVIGMIPHSLLLLATLFQKSILKRIKADRELWILIAGWLPCLLVFSFSGHVKLGRYIAYVFPMLTLFMSYNLIKFDLNNPVFLKRASRMTGFIATLMAILLTIVAFQNPDAVRQSPLFVAGVIVFVMGLLLTSLITVSKYSKVLSEAPQKVLPYYAAIYILFFSVLAYEYPRAEFLKPVRVDIWTTLSQAK